MLSTWLITVDVDLDHLAEVVFVTFLYHEVIFCFPFPMLSFLERCHCVQPTLRSRGLCSTSSSVSHSSGHVVCLAAAVLFFLWSREGHSVQLISSQTHKHFCMLTFAGVLDLALISRNGKMSETHSQPLRNLSVVHTLLPYVVSSLMASKTI